MRKVLLILCCLGFVACEVNYTSQPEQITETIQTAELKQENTYPVCDFSNMKAQKDKLVGSCSISTTTENKEKTGYLETNKTKLFTCNCISGTWNKCILPQEDFLYKNTYKETEIDGKYHNLDKSDLPKRDKIVKLTRRNDITTTIQMILENDDCSKICTIKCKDKLDKSSNMKEGNLTQDKNKMIGRCYIRKEQKNYDSEETDGYNYTRSEDITDYVCGCYKDIKGEAIFNKPMTNKDIGEKLPNEQCNTKCTEWCNKSEEERKI